MLAVENLSLHFGDRPIFSGISLRVNEGWRVALAGRNGQGKTTLFRVLAGQIALERGVVNVARDTKIGYLPQDIQPPQDPSRTVIAEVLKGAGDIEALEAKVTELANQLGEHPEDEKLLAAFGRAQAEFDAVGGYGLEAEARTLLDGLGFSQQRMDGPLDQLSGGWLMRVELTRLLLQKPDLLLLDEPTNHLDLETREWLLSFLQGFPGAIVLTSHDRFFLDALVDRVFELESGRLEVYRGNYTAFEAERALRLERLKNAAARQEREIAKQMVFIEKNRAKAATASNVQSRIKALDKIEKIQLPPEPPKVKLRFPKPPRSGQVALKLKGLAKSYGELNVFRDLDLEVDAGEKLVVVGLNGAGKTTLLKLIAGKLEPTAGSVEQGHNVSQQYFSQYEDDVHDTSHTILQVMEAAAPPQPEVPPRTVLGCFLFSGGDVDKPIEVLSGGERARVKIAKMLLRPANLLIMDEPTNHLDIHSQGVLLEALQNFPGTLVFVSHDREFIAKLATSVLEIDGGKATHFPNDYEQYRWRRDQDARAAAAAAAASPKPKAKQPTKPAPAPKPREKKKGGNKELMRARRKLVQETEALQEKIEAQEARVGELEASMSEAGFFEDPERSTPVVQEHKALQMEVALAYDQLEEALGRLEALEEG